jgi:hypothetical protein
MKLGACHVETPFIELGQLSTVLYFGYFIIIVPVISLIENTLVDLSSRWNKKQSYTISISTVGINNNNPRIFKRSFHSTKSLRTPDLIDAAIEMMKSESMYLIIHDATVHLQY